MIRTSSVISKLPVLIVGGGVGGFTTALSLHRAGIQNSIVMAESKFTQRARSGVFLGGSAIRILDRLGLGSQYRAIGTPMYSIQIEDVKGQPITSFKLDDMGAEVWTVPREILQQLLFEAIPSESVYTETKFRSLVVDGPHVHVNVQQGRNGLATNGLRPVSHFETNFVIGADGLNSAVRMFMSRPVMTVPSGVVVWRAIVRNRDLEAFPRHIGREIWDINRRFGFARMNREEVVWWAVVSNFHEVVLRPFTPHLMRLFGNFPDFTLDLVSTVESDRSIYRAEMKRVWPEQFPWVDHSSSRIALVGDAGRPDNTGNFHTSHMFAIEDSYVLASLLAEQNERGLLLRGPRLDRYEESREERRKATTLLARRFNHLSASKSAFQRYLANRLLHFSAERLASRGVSSTIPTTLQTGELTAMY